MKMTELLTEFDDLLEKEKKSLDADLEIDPLGDELEDYEGEEDIETAFTVMKCLMDKYKDFCDYVQNAWKMQEIPHILRQRLITLDQHNQDKYQKLYLMINKYKDEMKGSNIRSPNEDDTF